MTGSRLETASSLPACSDACLQGAAIGDQLQWQGWFDGAALPNPGKIGLGVVLISPAGIHSGRSVLIGESGCNNEAELHALCLALEIASEAGARRLQLHGDSNVAVRYVRGPESTQIARLVVLVAQARMRIQGFEEVLLVWVPRHRNVEADRLSRQALGLPARPIRAAKGRHRSR